MPVIRRTGLARATVLLVADAERLARFGAHHVRRPRRIPYDLDVGPLALGDAQQLVLDLRRDHRAHRASRRGERHLDRHRAAVHRDAIDQAEVNDVDRNFRVVALAQNLVNLLFGDHPYKPAGRRCGVAVTVPPPAPVVYKRRRGCNSRRRAGRIRPAPGGDARIRRRRFAMPDKEEHYDESVDLFADEKYDEAIETYKRALEIDPRYTDALHGMVMCYQAKGDLDAAIELTRKHIEQEPEDILAFTNLSMFYQKKGMIKEAEAAGAEARRLDWKRQLKEGKTAKQ